MKKEERIHIDYLGKNDKGRFMYCMEFGKLNMMDRINLAIRIILGRGYVKIKTMPISEKYVQ